MRKYFVVFKVLLETRDIQNGVLDLNSSIEIEQPITDITHVREIEKKLLEQVSLQLKEEDNPPPIAGVVLTNWRLFE